MAEKNMKSVFDWIEVQSMDEIPVHRDYYADMYGNAEPDCSEDGVVAGHRELLIGQFDDVVGAGWYDADNFEPAYDGNADSVYLRYIGSETDCAKIPWDGVPGIKNISGMFEDRGDMTNIEGLVIPDTVDMRSDLRSPRLSRDEILRMAGFEEPIVAKGMQAVPEREIPAMADNCEDARDLHYYRELM